MNPNADSFGAQAATYAAARPTYPPSLFDWIVSAAPRIGTVWDVGTGSGQAALSLAARFPSVHATDADPAQIAQAPAHPNIAYAAAPAHRSGLPDASVDAITVATALHWFDFTLFWPEIRRVARPGALFAAWSYVWPETDDDVHERLIEPQMSIIERYWSAQNRLSWRGYPPGETGCPFAPIDAPGFVCTLRWRPRDLAAFMRSWSAHLRARQDGHEAELARIEADAVDALGETPREVRLPLVMRAARVSETPCA